MVAEAGLDLLEVRQRSATAFDATARDVGGRCTWDCGIACGATLDERIVRGFTGLARDVPELEAGQVASRGASTRRLVSDRLLGSRIPELLGERALANARRRWPR